jgi:UDP-N-acetylglucosamine transferase subunit ALG13
VNYSLLIKNFTLILMSQEDDFDAMMDECQQELTQKIEIEKPATTQSDQQFASAQS